MARTLWRLRRGTDHPRPAGRRWTGRLRRPAVFVRRGRYGYPHRPDPVTDPHRVYPVPRAPHQEVRVRPAPAGGSGHAGPHAAAAALPGTAATTYLLPGERTPGRRVRFVAANLWTVASLCLGVLAILLAMRGDVRLAALCLIACVICDGLDGALARRLGVSSPFGAQMDSMADLCAFGIAAPVVLYASLSGSVPPPAAAGACAIVAICAAIRLARFNITAHDSRFFHGVPTTAVAAVLALAVLVELPLPAPLQLAGMALLAFAMVSSFPYASLARLLRLPTWLWLLPLAGVLLNPGVTFLVLVGAYLASGPVVWLRLRRAA